MMNKKDYIKTLYKEFCSAKGIKNSFDENKEDFIDWILNQRRLLIRYFDFIQYLDSGILDKNILEIDKGIYDSLLKIWGNLYMISQYADTLKEERRSLILLKNPFNRQIIPIILNEQNKLFRPTNDILFLTHNPYDLTSIKNWYQIHNQKEQDILIGMFGKEEDLDKKAKLKVLKELQSRMESDTSFDYDTEYDHYFAVLKSKRKVKKLVRERTY